MYLIVLLGRAGLGNETWIDAKVDKTHPATQHLQARGASRYNINKLCCLNMAATFLVIVASVPVNTPIIWKQLQALHTFLDGRFHGQYTH